MAPTHSAIVDTVSFLARVNLIANKYMGDLIVPPVPESYLTYKGPYKQRRMKRWRKSHPPYYKSNGTMVWLTPNKLLCHPDDIAKMAELIKQQGLGVNYR